MSMLIMHHDGTYKLLSKGADNIMFELANPQGGFDSVGGKNKLQKHLDEYASTGLRTLVLAERPLREAEATPWLRQWNDALNDVGEGRKKLLEEAARMIECDLTILGCTAIEDRLQDDVPQTIADLRTAGVKVWVLTGDKMDTAINIGKSARLISQEMKLIKLKENKEISDDEEKKQIIELLQQKKQEFDISEQDCVELKSNLPWFEEQLSSLQRLVTPAVDKSSGVPIAMIVDGHCLALIFDDNDLKIEFLKIACYCRVVLACRVSPAQKAQVVKLVRDRRIWWRFHTLVPDSDPLLLT